MAEIILNNPVNQNVIEYVPIQPYNNIVQAENEAYEMEMIRKARITADQYDPAKVHWVGK